MDMVQCLTKLHMVNADLLTNFIFIPIICMEMCNIIIMNMDLSPLTNQRGWLRACLRIQHPMVKTLCNLFQEESTLGWSSLQQLSKTHSGSDICHRMWGFKINTQEFNSQCRTCYKRIFWCSKIIRSIFHSKV